MVAGGLSGAEQDMLRRLLAAAVVLTLGLPGAIATTTGAFADGQCPGGQTPVATEGGVVCVVVKDPGTPDHPGTPRNASGSGTESTTGCFKQGGTKVPCVTALGTWWSGHQCYAEPYDAPPGTPAWQGHADGSLWACTTCQVAGTASNCHVQVIWTAPGQAPGPPRPGELASHAVGLMPLAKAQVHTAPQAPDHTYVGVEDWLWVPQAQWTTLAKTVRAGGTSVTVTAAPSQVRWDMGAATQTCYARGSEWRAGMTDAAQTDCGYTYTVTSDSEPHGRFPISATIRYQVDWTCTGACTANSGTLGLVDAPAGVGSLQVLQRQTVVVR